MITVRFVYLTGIKRPVFRNARLEGSWNGWAPAPMQAVAGEDGCPAFAATATFPDAHAGRVVRWGVRLDGPQAANAWGINLEVGDPSSQERHRELTLPGAGRTVEERYRFTESRHLGAQKLSTGAAAEPGLRFAVWAPNAQAVDVVFSTRDHGYVGERGQGIDPSMPVVPLAAGPGGIWESGVLPGFPAFVGAPYMFRIRTVQGATVYQTDVHSRWQIGRGDVDPSRQPWNGEAKSLDGRVSCSVVVDQDVVRAEFEPRTSPPAVVGDDEFWRHEFTPGLPVPTSVDDLVVYELHVGALGFPRPETGTLADAMALVGYLADLGVNAVELLPISEFSGNLGWGYGNTHHFVIESSAGGRDKYKHFVRACHQRGIAVIQDVVYNHFDGNARRAVWEYDSTLPEQNIYYWYEGRSTDHPQPDGGYLDNGSSGWTPRFWEEPVRQLFISSAVEFVEEFHVDGLRVDLTQAIHRDNRLHANGWGVARANAFGQKFLREWSRTLRMVRPSVMLIAEDHTGWPAVTELPEIGGLGFDATWFAAFYHDLVGDATMGSGNARLIREAGYGHDGPLAMTRFAGRLWETHANRVAYHESHDEAGNAEGSLRTSRAAVGDAPLWGATRDIAEARCRVAFGLALLSAATPMFFMGEEVVAQKPYRYDNVAQSKEDLFGEREGLGARMFRFYQDLIRLRHANAAVRSHAIDILHVHDANRVLAFTRREGTSDLLVVASLNNRPFSDGYVIATSPDRLLPGSWQETFNSDSSHYGGADVGNGGNALPAAGGRIDVRLPANGFVVLQRR
ncbi:MAG: alpha-amylase family glycosyl hydrolase [Actinomycetota bacterium]